MEENKIYKVIMSAIPFAVLDKAEGSCGSNDELSIICEAIYELVDCWEKVTGLDAANAVWVPGHYTSEKKAPAVKDYNNIIKSANCAHWSPTIENMKIVEQQCNGTKEREICTCYGDKSKCNFY